MCFIIAGATPRSHRHETLQSRCARIAKPRNAQFLIHLLMLWLLLLLLLLLLRWLAMLLGCLRFCAVGGRQAAVQQQ